jgi:hypothetical protein
VSGCADPIADDALLDWWCGEPLAGRRRVEEHMLGCNPCNARLGVLQRMADGIATLLREGELTAVVAPAVLDRLRREGRRIREYAVPAGGGVQCTVGPDDDLLLARLGVELRGVSRLDLVSRIDDGPEHRLSDLPFDPASSELLLLPPVALIRERPSHLQTFELRAVAAQGETVIGRYAFHHTAWADTSGG